MRNDVGEYKNEKENTERIQRKSKPNNWWHLFKYYIPSTADPLSLSMCVMFTVREFDASGKRYWKRPKSNKTQRSKYTLVIICVFSCPFLHISFLLFVCPFISHISHLLSLFFCGFLFNRFLLTHTHSSNDNIIITLEWNFLFHLRWLVQMRLKTSKAKRRTSPSDLMAMMMMMLMVIIFCLSELFIFVTLLFCSNNMQCLTFVLFVCVYVFIFIKWFSKNSTI